jgi:hypothetical protein
MQPVAHRRKLGTLGYNARTGGKLANNDGEAGYKDGDDSTDEHHTNWHRKMPRNLELPTAGRF